MLLLLLLLPWKLPRRCAAASAPTQPCRQEPPESARHAAQEDADRSDEGMHRMRHARVKVVRIARVKVERI